MTGIEVGKQVFLQLGTTWILCLPGLLSVGSIVLSVERWLYYRSCDTDIELLAQNLDGFLARRDIPGAMGLLGPSKSLAASIARAGLKMAAEGPAAAEKAMQSATALERSRLERRLTYLGTLGNNAPFIGLFGTVIGVISAFEELGHGAPGHAGASAANQVASQAVMSSIAEALVATAVGLLVALPAVAAYNYLQRRVAELLAESEVVSTLVLAYLVAGPRPPSSVSVSGSVETR